MTRREYIQSTEGGKDGDQEDSSIVNETSLDEGQRATVSVEVDAPSQTFQQGPCDGPKHPMHLQP